MWPEAGGTILSPEFLKLSRRKGCPGPQIRGIQAGGSGLRWACGSQEDRPTSPAQLLAQGLQRVLGVISGAVFGTGIQL